MPNKLDLIRDIALGTDNAERKAYSNNKYGLVAVSYTHLDVYKRQVAELHSNHNACKL